MASFRWINWGSNPSRFHKRLARFDDVQRGVALRADLIKVRADGLLAQHRRTGDITVDVDHSGVDSVVSMTSTSEGKTPAIALETGHVDARTGNWVEGKYILTRAALDD